MRSTESVSGCEPTVRPVISTAFQPAFVSSTVWPEPGKVPSDQLLVSQLPLWELVQLLVWAAARRGTKTAAPSILPCHARVNLRNCTEPRLPHPERQVI